MHPSVDKAESAPTRAKSPSIEIDYACTTARPLLKESTMRITIKALLCSLLATACAPIGERGGDIGPDAGTSGDGSASTVCDNYESKTMDLTISGDSGFTGLPSKCWKLVGKLTLNGPAITTLAKLGDLREVRDLVVDGTALTKFDTKSPIKVTGDITVKNNSKLTEIANVTVEPALVKSITLEYNAELTGTGGLSAAEVISGATIIRNNTKLATVDLSHAKRFEGGLTISDNPAVTTFDLHSAESTGSIIIRNNAALTNIGSMPALAFIHGSLTIDNNDALTTLANTMMAGSTFNERKVWVDQIVTITNNNALATLGAIAHFKYVFGTVTFSGNTNLTYCEIRSVDCCVDTDPVVQSGNKTSSCNTTGYSWCVAETGGNCPFM
jgi:hypothetical protein